MLTGQVLNSKNGCTIAIRQQPLIRSPDRVNCILMVCTEVPILACLFRYMFNLIISILNIFNFFLEAIIKEYYFYVEDVYTINVSYNKLLLILLSSCYSKNILCYSNYLQEPGKKV